MRLFGKIIFSYPILGLLLTLVIFAAAQFGCPPLQLLDQQLFDRLIELRKSPGAEKVVVVAIDLKSRKQLGDTPWSRLQLAQLVASVQRQNPAAIGLILPASFASDSPQADLELADQARNLALRLEETRGITSGDVPYFQQNSLIQKKQLPPAIELLKSLRNPLTAFLPQPTAPLLLPPMSPLQKSVHAGPLSLNSDRDGQLRRLPLLSPWQERLLPALPLQLLRIAEKLPLGEIDYGPAALAGPLKIGKHQFELGANYQLLLDRSGQHPRWETISASDLLQQKLSSNGLGNRIVLIGEAPPPGTPLSADPLKAATLATVSLLNAAPLFQPAWGWLVESLVLLYFGLFCFLLLPRLSNRFGLSALLFSLIVWISSAAIALFTQGIWLQVAPALTLALLGYGLVHYTGLRRELASSVAESNKTLGRTLQEQGLLDLALERFLRCPPGDTELKELLYNLGLAFERKRLPHKALTVYLHLQSAGRFRDIKQRIKQLKEQNQTLVMDEGGTMRINPQGEKPMLGRYRIEKVLGQGAMGTVYLGVDPKINRRVAIKTLAYGQIEPAELTEVKARFFREAEAAGRLSHPHIVTVYDVGEEADLAYMAMELLEGNDLSRYCDKKNRLAPLKILEYGGQIAAALEYAHRHDVVHRDIKPANIMLDKNGQVKVTDFGVARMVSSSRTETGIVLGTPSYMSPEQVAGKRVDGRSDLFSLGVVFYELFSGEKPFVAESLAALMYNIANAKYRPLQELCPNLPQDCVLMVDKLLNKSPNRRYKSADLLQRELFDLLETMEGR